MLKKFLREVVSTIVGKHAEEIADLLNDKKHVNEFTIAKKMDLTINQTRNILYKISDQSLVSSIRKKDKKKGWYTYFWKIEVIKSLEFLRAILLKRINQIEHQIVSRETKKYFVCERCNIEFSEENALLNDFTCNECGDVFTMKNNERILREFKRNLSMLVKKLETIDVEINFEKEKIEKKKFKEEKKIEKEKLEAKALKRKLTKKKNAEKKIVKKKVKKKTIKKKKIVKRKSIKKKVVKKKITKKLSKKKVSKRK